MINNESLLEQKFGNMLKQMQECDIFDFTPEQQREFECVLDFNLNEICRFMHSQGADNSSDICQFVLINNDYPETFSEKQKIGLQKFCDWFEEDGFKFEVGTSTHGYVSLLWKKDDEFITSENFELINDLLKHKNKQKRQQR